MPQYFGDLIAWAAIGARTTESQTHREMASGLSTPVGFKNGTDGSLGMAVNALKSAREPHAFLGINQDGRSAVFRTRGNPYGHIVLRGGGGRPNYDSVSVALAEKALKQAVLVLDRRHSRQPARFRILQKTVCSPTGFIRKPDRPDFPGLHEFAEHGQDFADMVFGRDSILTGRVIGPGLAEMIMTAVRPVELIKIDIVGFQPVEAVFNSVADGRS